MRASGGQNVSGAFLLGAFLGLTAFAAEASSGELGTLERLLLARDWQAVEMAQKEGARAVLILRRSSANPDYRVRQIAVTCAGRIGCAGGAGILATGLVDRNINVRLAAANELAVNPCPAAAETILEQIEKSADETVREKLVLAAGQLPASRALAVLRPLASGQGTLAVKARMALARLGDAGARQTLRSELSSKSPRARYDALEHLRYVNDPELAGAARGRLTDREPAIRLGVPSDSRFRRVCDQALETVVYLRKLQVRFEVNVERIYSDEELAWVGDR
ncbi:MAG: HEAT repeat domain-containing protein [Opitutus sp.]